MERLHTPSVGLPLTRSTTATAIRLAVHELCNPTDSYLTSYLVMKKGNQRQKRNFDTLRRLGAQHITVHIKNLQGPFGSVHSDAWRIKPPCSNGIQQFGVSIALPPIGDCISITSSHRSLSSTLFGDTSWT